jgi:hypothetical protein
MGVTIDFLLGVPLLHKHDVSDITGLPSSSAWNFAGTITVAADFPTPVAVANGDVYRVLADVTDNDGTKTNTGDSFVTSSEIVWNGTDWTNIGIDGVLAHGADHILGATDEIDGDQLGIDLTPSNYTPDVTPAEVTNVDHLSAHLAGIDNVLLNVGTDDDAIHDNVPAEISAIAPKAIPAVGDYLLIEDSADSDNKKSITIGDLPGGDTSGIVYKSFSLQTDASGSDYIAGFYDFDNADANLTQASLTVTYGSSTNPYAAHASIVAGGAGTVDTGVVGLRVTGTSIDDDGVRTPADSETIVGDITALSLNQYVEGKKWIGAVTFELFVVSGAPTTYSLDFNYGFAKYEDFGNNDFTVEHFEVVGRAGGNDSNFGVTLFLHGTAGWTYAATGFTPGGTALADLGTDHVTEDDLNNGEYFAYKRSNLNTLVNGADSQGIVICAATSVGQAVEYMDAHVGVTGLSFLGALDADAIHVNGAGEISGIAPKTDPIAADYVVIEDSEAGDIKKRVTIGDLLEGGGAVVSDNYAWVYDTTTQTIALANTFQNITFDTNAELDGWTHTAGTAEFTCNHTGLYEVIITGNVEKAGGGNLEAAVRALFNGVEVPGSHFGMDVTANNTAFVVSRNFMVDAVAGQDLEFQVAANSLNISLLPGPNPGTATTTPSVGVTIRRVS